MVDNGGATNSCHDVNQQVLLIGLFYVMMGLSKRKKVLFMKKIILSFGFLVMLFFGGTMV